MRRFQRILNLLALVALAGCSDLTGPGGKRSDLDDNRRKWDSRGYADYSFTMQTICFCGFTDPIKVTVVGDSVVSAVRVSNGQSVPFGALTVHRLFDIIKDAIDRPSDNLRVTYDATLGFPSDVYIDGSYNIADDEVEYVIRDVAPIARTTR